MRCYKNLEGNLHFYPKEYKMINPQMELETIDIISISSEVVYEDIKTENGWKFKIDDKGHLSYDLDKIAAKLAKDIDNNREQEYSQKVDKLVIEKMRKQLKDPEIDAIVDGIKKKYPKVKE